MKILFVCHKPPSRTSSGGGAIYEWQSVSALKSLGHSVYVLSLSERPEREDPIVTEVEGVEYFPPRPLGPFDVETCSQALLGPELASLVHPGWRGIEGQVRRSIDAIQPDLIWADSIGAMAFIPKDAPPILYAHHDFLHRLESVRRRTDRKLRRSSLVPLTLLKRLEKRLCSRASSAISASASEGSQLSRWGISCQYIPVVGPYLERSTVLPRARPAVVLLGRSNTAMRATRQDFVDNILPLITPLKLDLDWHQVGSPPSRRERSFEALFPLFDRRGFVDDIADAIRPADLSLVSYPYDTGFRTKFVTACALSAVNIGYAVTYLCSREFSGGENCLMAEDPKHLADEIERFANDAGLRKRLSEASRVTYEERFTLEHLLPRYQAALVA